MSPIIGPEELVQLHESNNIVLVDASNAADAFKNYWREHLEKALFVDVNKDLSTLGDPKFGGRHPLPSIPDFLNVLTGLGISKKSHVVIYDNSSGANAAARFWWMLKAIGHEKVQVLDGGFQNALKHGFPTSVQIIRPVTTSDYSDIRWNLPLATIDDVRESIETGSHLIIDVREKHGYDGISEPIDAIAGHIPTALNVPFKENLDKNGNFKNPIDLLKMYRQIIGDRNPEHVIVHCGSGVTACHTLLAFEIAGLKIPKLYVGSWSEWSRNSNNPEVS